MEAVQSIGLRRGLINYKLEQIGFAWSFKGVRIKNANLDPPQASRR
jgi:hypothetical protein